MMNGNKKHKNREFEPLKCASTKMNYEIILEVFLLLRRNKVTDI